MTPTREELAELFGRSIVGAPSYCNVAADIVLPLLAERDAEVERLNAEVLKGIEKVVRLGAILKVDRAAHRARRDLMRQHGRAYAELLHHLKRVVDENERLKAQR